MGDRTFGGILLDETKPCEIIHHLLFGASGDGGNFPAFLHRPHLFQGERIALDGCRGMGVARARVLLQCGNPANLNRAGQDAFAQRGNLLHAGEQCRGDSELGLVTHARNLPVSQV